MNHRNGLGLIDDVMFSILSSFFSLNEVNYQVLLYLHSEGLAIFPGGLFPKMTLFMNILLK